MSDITSRQPQAAAAPSAASLRLVVGYDGSPPASRALDSAAGLLQGRDGGIDVVYVDHAPGVDALSAGALAQIRADFDEIEKKLRVSAATQLDARGVAWEFRRRRGLITGELMAAASAISDARPGDIVAIVIGSSSHASHRVAGSVAVGLARHCPVPLLIVP